MKRTLAAGALALLSIFAASVATEPQIGPVTIDPPQVGINAPTVVHVTATIPDETVIRASPNLQRLNPDGRVTIVGTLRDDGTNGDAVAGDKVFSISFPFTATEQGEIRYRVSAAFTGKLRRLFSPLLTITATGGSTTEVTVTGEVQFDTGQPAAGALVLVGLGATRNIAASRTASSVTTDSSGHFSASLHTGVLPVRVLVQVTSPTSPATDTARWREADGSLLDVGTIMIPSLDGAAIPLSNNSGQSADGSIRVSNLPSNVSRLYARSYDPDVTRDAFPGEFAENGLIPLNSSVFLWAQAVTATGVSVHQLNQPATFRVRVPRSQWVDLEDIHNGTDRIEIPIYTLDETTQLWVQDSVGWVEDETGAVLPEEAEPAITGGTFGREVFATFVTNHLSWLNVDYAFVGPWTLSRMVNRDHRNNDCYFDALQLARRIALSQAGQTAFSTFNTPGASLEQELADAAGPEVLDSGSIGTAYGEFKGNEMGDRDDQLHLNERLWNNCGAGATDDQKRDTTLIMAVTLLHETAHWKWDVKHENGTFVGGEPGGEAGEELERDLFGGIITDTNGILRDGIPVSDAVRDGWLDPNNWPSPLNLSRTKRTPTQVTAAASPLQVTIALPKQAFQSGEEIPVAVTYRNISGAPIRVLNTTDLEGRPLWFNAIRSGGTVRVPFSGPRIKRQIDFARDFTTLAPGAVLQKTVSLLRDPVTGERRYNFTRSGSYVLTGFYSGHFGLPETPSNPVTFTIAAGGNVAGIVRDADTGRGIAGATVRALQNGNPIVDVTTDAAGAFAIAELAQGVYTFEGRANGFLRSTIEPVSITSGQRITLDFALVPFIVNGEIKIVLTWGETPRDLDSHLWLPLEIPYHVDYSRRGAQDVCPNASLDLDDTNGFGPETVTISRRYTGGTYVYAVHDYTRAGVFTGARVQVLDSSGVLATFTPPSAGTGVWWRVFAIDGRTGRITESNAIGDDPAPYPDTGAGCSITSVQTAARARVAG